MSKKKRNWIPWMEQKRERRKEFEEMCVVLNKAAGHVFQETLFTSPLTKHLMFNGGKEIQSPFHFEVR